MSPAFLQSHGRTQLHAPVYLRKSVMEENRSIFAQQMVAALNRREKHVFPGVISNAVRNVGWNSKVDHKVLCCTVSSILHGPLVVFWLWKGLTAGMTVMTYWFWGNWLSFAFLVSQLQMWHPTRRAGSLQCIAPCLLPRQACFPPFILPQGPTLSKTWLQWASWNEDCELQSCIWSCSHMAPQLPQEWSWHWPKWGAAGKGWTGGLLLSFALFHSYLWESFELFLCFYSSAALAVKAGGC